jgi:proline iminopeptidase
MQKEMVTIMRRLTLTFALLILYIGALGQSNSNRIQNDSGYIEIDGSKLKFVTKGVGLPCIVIGSSIYYPRTFSPDLHKLLKLYYVDMKWFAKDYDPENLDNVDINSIVEDVEQIRLALGLEKPLIMGHSIHGTIAMEYVKKYSEKVSGLVVVGSPCEWGNSTYDSKAKALWETASEERRKLQEENWGKLKEIDRLVGQKEASARYNNMSPQYWFNPRYDATWLWDDMTVHSEVTQHLFNNVFKNYNMFNPAVNIPVPVFLALGKYDYVIPYTLWKKKYESIPNFNYVLFEKSGHTPQLEESELFNKALIKWLNSKF